MTFGHLESIQSLAVVGAAGLVGGEFLGLLAEHKIKIGDLRLLDTPERAGERVTVGEDEFTVEALSEDSFQDVEVAFFRVPPEVSRKYAPLAARAGAVVIDGSGVFCREPDVPLVVPEINGARLRDFQGKIIALPNSAVTALALCLTPLHEAYGITRVVLSTYQAVSGDERAAYEELSEQAISLLSGGGATPGVYPHQIAFNCLPEIGTIGPDGSSEEEETLAHELRHILEIPDLRVGATAVRVPTFCGHAVSAHVELEHEPDIDAVRESLDRFPGVKVLDKPSRHIYPTNMECVGSDYALVGRIRRDKSAPNALAFWVVTDNLRKGAALNALQIMETLYKYRRMS